MTDCGKHGKPRSRLSPFPYSLEIPSGLPHSHGLDCWHISRCKSMRDRIQRFLDLKGVVMEVLGPRCNERSSTLIPARATEALKTISIDGPTKVADIRT